MRSHEVEAWALRVLDQVRARHPVEDMRVELKGAWIDAALAARRIAAHANAAHGEEILWLIGVDEQRGVTGAEHKEFSDWWAAVQACFNELPPTCVHHFNVTVDGLTLVALVIETDRAPFVVKNPAFGKTGEVVEREVPWREGTATRSARRSDLVRILSPLQRLPEIEVLSGTVDATTNRMSDGEHSSTIFNLAVGLYVVPKGERRLVIPFHRCIASLLSEDWPEHIELRGLSIRPNYEVAMRGVRVGIDPPPRNRSHTIEASDSEALISGPGLLNLSGASEWIDSTGHELPGAITLRAKLSPVEVEVPVEIDATFDREETGDHSTWLLRE